MREGRGAVEGRRSGAVSRLNPLPDCVTSEGRLHNGVEHLNGAIARNFTGSVQVEVAGFSALLHKQSKLRYPT